MRCGEGWGERCGYLMKLNNELPEKLESYYPNVVKPNNEQRTKDFRINNNVRATRSGRGEALSGFKIFELFLKI